MFEKSEKFENITALKTNIIKSIIEKYSTLISEIPYYNYDDILDQLNNNLSLSYIRTNFYEIKIFLEYEKRLKELRSQVVLNLVNELYSNLTKFENVDNVNNLSGILQDLANVCLKFSTTENLKFNLNVLIDTFLNSSLGIFYHNKTTITSPIAE